MGYHFLDGVRIIDLSMVFAGPVGTKIFAELGAEVIKIESVQHAEVFTRTNVYPENKPGDEPWNRGCFFHTLNAGKRGIRLNLGSEEGREIFKRLVEISDVVFENFSPRVMEKWGLGYEALKKIKPDIIMVSMSGLGHDGPLRGFYMYVPGMEGMSGLTHNTGYPEEPPLPSGYAYGDWLAGATAAAALMTALYYRQRTGKGQYIDLAGREAAACHIGELMMDFTLNGRDRTRIGNRHPQAAPHGCYRCKGDDNWVNIAIEDDAQWERFCRAIGSPAWSREARYATASGRRQSQDELDQLIEKWTEQRDHLDVMKSLQEAGVPSGAVLSMKELNLDPHLIERGFFQVIEHGDGVGKRPIATQLPAKFSGAQADVAKRAPRLGEDEEYVFGQLLGMSKAEITKLEEEKVIGGAPRFPGMPARTDLIEEQKAGWFDPDYLGELRKRHGEDIG